MKEIKNETMSFFELFDNDKKYLIPHYQRRYDWDKENIEDYFESIVDHQKDLYYFGNIILIEKHLNNTYEIVDGQQRITTLYLLLFSLYQKSLERYKNIEKQKRNDIYNEFW